MLLLKCWESLLIEKSDFFLCFISFLYFTFLHYLKRCFKRKFYLIRKSLSWANSQWFGFSTAQSRKTETEIHQHQSCVKKPNRETRSWRTFDSPSTIPHAVFLPRTRLPFTWYSLSLPTTAKGIASCEQRHLNMVQCTEEIYARFMRWNKCTTRPSALAFCLGDSLHVCERGWVKAEYQRFILMPRKKIARQISRETKKATYSDFIVVTLVFHVIIKLFLWVKFNPAHLQLLPYLECRQKQGKMNLKKKH